MEMNKKYICVNRTSPHGTAHAAESLDLVLAALAFELGIVLVFMDDGVFQLIKQQDTSAIGQHNFTKTYRALGDWGLKKIYVEEEAMLSRGLSIDDLQNLTYEDEACGTVSMLHLTDRKGLAKLMDEGDVILSF